MAAFNTGQQAGSTGRSTRGGPGPGVAARLVRVALVGLCGLVASCGEVSSFHMTAETGRVYFSDYTPEERAALREKVLRSLRDGRSRGPYTLRVGDQVEVMYHVRPRPVQEYALQVGDEIAVRFPENAALDTETVIRPDGWVSLPESPGLPAAGLSVQTLNDRVRAHYAEIFRDSRPNVALQAWQLPGERLVADLQSFGTGTGKLVTVMPDGRIALPFLPPIMARGRDIQAVGQEINAAYDALGLQIDVSVLLNETMGDRLFVFGEVQDPGMMEAERQQTVLMTVARAGGVTPNGRLSDVRVVYLDEDGQPTLRRVNLINVLTELKLEEDMVLPDNAIVYVPPSDLARVSRLLDQVLRQILFFQGTSLGVSYEPFPYSPTN